MGSDAPLDSKRAQELALSGAVSGGISVEVLPTQSSFALGEMPSSQVVCNEFDQSESVECNMWSWTTVVGAYVFLIVPRVDAHMSTDPDTSLLLQFCGFG